MGGAGGYTCMSEDATFQIEEWLTHYESLGNMERSQMILYNQMIARALALQQAALIPMHTDLVWVNDAVHEVDMASLAQRH